MRLHRLSKRPTRARAGNELMPRLRFIPALIIALCLSVAHAAETPVEQGRIEVHIAAEDKELAERTATVLYKGLEQYKARLPIGPEPVQVFVCLTLDEFSKRAGGGINRNVSGIAIGSQGVMVVKAPALLSLEANYNAILRHELIHLLLARNTNPDNLPRWLNEGIAMVVSRENRWSSTFRLVRMYAGGGVISYNALPFAFAAPGNETEFGDAYAQSLSMTRFLMKEVGEETFWAIISDLREMPFERALFSRTSLTPQGMFARWSSSLWKVAAASYSMSGIIAFQFMGVLVVVAYLRKRWRGKKIIAGWIAEEAEEAEEDNIIFPWQLEDNEPPYPWEED